MTQPKTYSKYIWKNKFPGRIPPSSLLSHPSGFPHPPHETPTTGSQSMAILVCFPATLTQHRVQEHLGTVSYRLQFITDGSQGKSSRKWSLRNVACWLAFSDSFTSFLIQTAQANLLGNGTIYSGLGSPTSISNQENATWYSNIASVLRILFLCFVSHSSVCCSDYSWLPGLCCDSVSLGSSFLGLKTAWKHGWSYRIALHLLSPGAQWLLDYFIETIKQCPEIQKLHPFW